MLDASSSIPILLPVLLTLAGDAISALRGSIWIFMTNLPFVVAGCSSCCCIPATWRTRASKAQEENWNVD
jgi:hypothetical protein